MKIKTQAIGVNRADVFYRMGKYPTTGMELAGLTADGRKICGIVDGGAFAKEVEVPEECILEIPIGMSFIESAAIIEGLFTAYYNLVVLGKLQKGESVLIHGGAGGIGPIAIQLASLLGTKVTATAGKPEKLKLIESLGATALDYHSKEFGKEQFDIILDVVGGDYFNANVQALKKNGRLAIISFIGGAKVEANLAPMLIKNLTVFSSTIRSLPLDVKAKIRDGIAPYLNKIKPIVDCTFPLKELDKALDYVEQYKNIGKVVVTTD